MEEQRLYDVLGEKLEVPDVVNRKLEEAYAQLDGQRSPVKWKGLRPIRTVLIAAALIAALCVTATAAYQIFRLEIPADKGKTVEGILGNGQPSWEERYVYDGSANPFYWPNRETVEVDRERAQRLLGDYLPECGYQWQIGDYTFTVEGYVLDEFTGAAKFYYSIEHPGGFPEGAVDWEFGTLSYKSRISVMFSSKSDVEGPWISGKIKYVDMARSTAEKLYLMEGAAGQGGWRAEDGLNVIFTVHGETDRDDDVLSVDLELPGVKSLPVVTVTDPETGKLTAAISPIAVKADAQDAVHYVALEYADGTSYVIKDYDVGLDNADYGMYDNEFYLTEVFNRLVDPAQVTAVIVDSQRYEMGH